jgi:hypothetical protein
MQSTIVKRLAMAGLVLVIVWGCTSVMDQVLQEGDATAGFARVESVFSDAPSSPGGTGGVGEPAEQVAEQEGEVTRSFFTAFQIDPVREDSAGPKFVTASDIDQDGLLDLVSGWNQSQPVQLHLQRRDFNGNLSFRTITLAGTTPVGVMAGVEVGFIDDDTFPDVVVLVKATGYATFCPPAEEGGEPEELGALDGEILVYFNPGAANLIPDGDRWVEMTLVNPYIADTWIHNQFPGEESKDFHEMKTKPEWGGFTSLAVADVDGVPGDDILVALNPAECATLGQMPPLNTVDLWLNPGAAQADQAELWGTVDPSDPGRRVPVTLLADVPQVKDVVVMDIDGDADLDVIATYTNAISLNVRWSRNPLFPHSVGGPSGPAAVASGVSDGFRLFADLWQDRPIGQVDTAADVLSIGDVDADGFDDLLVRSTDGQILQWFRRPNPLSIQPEFPPNDTVPDRIDFPWPVFTLAEFRGREPEAIAAGDLTGDGFVDVVAAAGGAVSWYDGSVYDPWFGNTIIQDQSNDLDGDGVVDDEDGCPSDPNKIEPGICGCGLSDPDCSTPNLASFTTHINSLLVVDLDADGRNDILATLDRRSGSGLSQDQLIWYRNIRTEDNGETSVRPNPEKDEDRIAPPGR